MREYSLALLFLTIGCTYVPTDTGDISAYFCPRDDCAGIIATLMQNANRSIHCSFYSFDIHSMIKILLEKSRKIDVRLVLNGRNYKNQISGDSIKLTKRNNHNKFCIIDDKVVITGSFNPTKSGLDDRNNLVIVHSDIISENYEDEFSEQWAGSNDIETTDKIIIIDGKRVQNIFCPDDDCKGYYLRELRNARSSIYFMIFSFTSEDVADVLLTINASVKGIVDNSQSNNQYSQYSRLKGFGLDIGIYNKNTTLHHKVFIIDNRTVITGSANPTANGFSGNDENILIIHDKDIAEKYLKEFEGLE